jgi:hypothetical protein
MNVTPEDSEEFSLKRRLHTERDSDTNKRGEDAAAKPAPTDQPDPETVQGAFPDRIRRKYYVVANESGKDGREGEARLYADERGEYLAFKVTEDRLVTRLAAAEVIRDMVSVAQHRQWEALDVRGSVEFQREAWLEAGARGLEVRGYQPTDLDRQALSDRRETWNRANSRIREAEVRSVADRDGRVDKFDYDKGASGRLIEVGRAPYRNHADAETSPYVTIELESGRRHRVWGVDLEKATMDSGARPGDRIHVRRHGVEHVAKKIRVIDAVTGVAGIERRQVPRNRWRVTAETFRAAGRLTAARDPALTAAQSQIVVIEKLVERAFPKNEHIRQSITAAVKERIAQHLETGHSFARATVMEPVRERQQSGRDQEVRQSQSDKHMRMQERER